MKERPIIFSAPMVRALIAGTKTQTRRVIKPLPVNVVPFIGRDNLPTFEYGLCLRAERVISKHVRCPYGQPGDRLWVRETHWAMDKNTIFYRADGHPDNTVIRQWTPSIHMPRWASRITLEITGICVERLQDISDEEAEFEGCSGYRNDNDPFRDIGPRDEYHELWESINGANSWDANPWVWVVEFIKQESQL